MNENKNQQYKSTTRTTQKELKLKGTEINWIQLNKTQVETAILAAIYIYMLPDW